MARLAASENLRGLGRTVSPYVGQTLILFGVTIFVFCVAFKKADWNFLWATTLVWILYGAYVAFICAPYRILWNGDSVVMRASGLKERCIRFNEIAEIKYQLASPSEFAAPSRPFRRFVVLPLHHPKQFIDISLRHFRLEDIEDLMAAIHAARPDLELPKVPMNRRYL
ncbi:MAG TPA: hypothetical protein VL986_08160 [Terracidiphilus sp.]|nr:hypothetical protein [Terracidiphilus sp.]